MSSHLQANIASTQLQSLAHLLNATHDKHHVVAFDGTHQWTWQQLQRDVTATLQRISTFPAQRIALCTQDSYRFAVGLLAICHSGKSLILPGNYQPAALAELACQFDLLLHDDGVEPIAGRPCHSIGVNSQQDSIKTFAILDLNATKVVLFTSGSSGTPKAISKTLQLLNTEIAILESVWGTDLKNCMIESTVSHQHIYGLLFRVLWPLCSGRAFACQNLEYPEQVMSHASENCVLISSPALLKRLSTQTSLATYRALFSSGGPLPYQAAQQAHSLFSHLPIEVYGSTETGGIAFKQQHTADEYWRLFPGVKAELNQEGCLRLKSPHIDPESWYQTADACVLHSDGRFELKGRTDRIIKIEEKRISLVEIEKRLDQLDWICESAVFSAQSEQRLSLNAAIVLSQAGQCKLESIGKGKFWLQLRSELRQWIEPIAIPRRFRVVQDIPLNSQGKRQLSELESLFSETHSPTPNA
ncbi:AMP-binding protein [Vibrio methylphosphonaticus]|uniref:AMP-binding protein n=1 Tax=Vibrio methylphosphonaticus TaxID=2946866 RepID=UPI00202A893C|nr:AMP-binding protein [Vibrio methylphosphonaticus]MCL9774238.1 AMP-binding protein [Vibrio methylphosphonaticus]